MNTLRILSYNIHHGEGTDGAVDLARVAAIIAAIKPDIAALQEVDCNMPRTSRVDQLRELAEQTQMTGLFGCALDRGADGHYGNAILSRLPVKSYANYPLPGEPRAVLAAEIDLSSVYDDATTMLFMATHLDTASAPRLASIPQLEEARSKHRRQPAILAGDLNATPDSPTLAALSQCWSNTTAEREIVTFPHGDQRQIDYILLRPQKRWRVASVQSVDDTIASDHLPIFADLQWLPCPEESLT